MPEEKAIVEPQERSLEKTPCQGSVYLITSDGRTLRLPIPSRSQNDPLNWSMMKRALTLAAMSLFTILGLIQVQGTSLLLPALEHEYAAEEIVPLRLDMLSSIPTLFWGIGALAWVPLSVAIGRRPVFLFCTLLLTISTMIAAVSQTFYTHLVARCLQGLAGAISPSTMILMIIDVTYIHERPFYLALYWCICNAFPNVFLAATPAIISAGGSWRAFYWIWSIPCIVSMIVAIAFAPETYFQRPAMALDGHVISQASDGRVTVYKDWTAVPGGKPVPDAPTVWKSSRTLKKVIFWNRTATGGWSSMKAFRRQLLICAVNPLIFWILILNALVFGGMVITCSTYVELLSMPPYNFTPTQIGLSKFSNAIGAFVAFPAAGILTTWIIRKLAARNRGVREPEHYLPSFVIPVITSTVSLALYGIASERHWHWRWVLLFVGLDYFAAISLFTSNTLWVTESFPRWAGPALVIVGAGGYALSFGLSSGFGPLVAAHGLGRAYIELALVTLVVGLVGLPANCWGKRLRQYIYAYWGEDEIVNEDRRWG